ncbi:MAG: hypothetical protein AAGC92_01485 [Pseudomonadota bacterium]
MFDLADLERADAALSALHHDRAEAEDRIAPHMPRPAGQRAMRYAAPSAPAGRAVRCPYGGGTR